LSYEWMQSDQLPDILSGEEVGSIPMGHALLSIRSFDSPVFPTQGISAKLRYDQSLSGAGTSRIFRTLATEGVYVPPFKIPLSFTVYWRGGTDFSEYADDSTAAPLSYKPNLKDRHFSRDPGNGGTYRQPHRGPRRGDKVPAELGLPRDRDTFLPVRPNGGGYGPAGYRRHRRGVKVYPWDGRPGDWRARQRRIRDLVPGGRPARFVSDLRPFVAFDLGSIGY